ncbi:MAG: AMP-binding protein, partial [Bdellovibrionales bacterium]|nr:AMP-binding protein [Bdellovibrionales bacterium]
MSWINFLDQSAQQYPLKTALVEQQSGRRLTYQELNLEVTRLAQLFASNGLSAGDRMAYLALNNLEHVTFFL